LRWTEGFDACRKAGRSSKMAEGFLLGTVLRSGFFVASSVMLASSFVFARQWETPRAPSRRGALHLLGGFDCGDLALPPPFLGGFVTDQRARADLHGERPPPFTLHFEKLIFGNTVQPAEFP